MQFKNIDVWYHILKFCNIRTVQATLGTCRQFNSLNGNLLWNILTAEHFPEIVQSHNLVDLHAMDKYIRCVDLQHYRNVILTKERSEWYDNAKIRVIDEKFYIRRHNVIYLIGNYISEIPETWYPDTVFLQMQGNLITSIPENWLCEPSRIRAVEMGNNLISSIPSNWNPCIRGLQLSRNCIEEIPFDWNPTHISSLRLNGNPISVLPENWLYGTNVRSLYLAKTNIEYLPENWRPPIEHLFIGKTPIKRESLDAFRQRNPHIIIHTSYLV